MMLHVQAQLGKFQYVVVFTRKFAQACTSAAIISISPVFIANRTSIIILAARKKVLQFDLIN